MLIYVYLFIYLFIESRGLATWWCSCYLFYNVPTINKLFLLFLLLLLLLNNMYVVVIHDPGECQNPNYWVVNSCSCNWLGKSGNKPLPEPMLNHAPISRRIFRSDSNSRENFWFLCNAIIGYHIATKLYTCHDSTAVVPCAKLHSDHFHWKSDDSRMEFPSNLH